jgi:hypothetical protein
MKVVYTSLEELDKLRGQDRVTVLSGYGEVDREATSETVTRTGRVQFLGGIARDVPFALAEALVLAYREGAGGPVVVCPNDTCEEDFPEWLEWGEEDLPGRKKVQVPSYMMLYASWGPKELHDYAQALLQGASPYSHTTTPQLESKPESQPQPGPEPEQVAP